MNELLELITKIYMTKGRDEAIRLIEEANLEISNYDEYFSDIDNTILSW